MLNIFMETVIYLFAGKQEFEGLPLIALQQIDYIKTQNQNMILKAQIGTRLSSTNTTAFKYSAAKLTLLYRYVFCLHNKCSFLVFPMECRSQSNRSNTNVWPESQSF